VAGGVAALALADRGRTPAAPPPSASPTPAPVHPKPSPAASPSPEDPATPLLRSAHEAYERKDYKTSKEYAAKATALSPENGAAWTALAEAETGLGELASAEEHARKGVGLAPGLAEAQYELARATRDRNTSVTEHPALDRALELDPLNEHAWVLKAEMRMVAHDWPAAIDAIDRALALKPSHAGYYFVRAAARRNLRDRGCLEDFETALQPDPSREDYWLKYIQACENELADPAGALALAQRAVAANPKNERLQQERARLRTKLGR
jgi:tetratricopeptide (TPR) repeat protein